MQHTYIVKYTLSQITYESTCTCSCSFFYFWSSNFTYDLSHNLNTLWLFSLHLLILTGCRLVPPILPLYYHLYLALQILDFYVYINI